MEIVAQLVPHVMSIHPIMKLLDTGDLIVADHLTSCSASYELQPCNNIKYLANIFLRQLSNPRSAVRKELDQTLRRQYLQGLS